MTEALDYLVIGGGVNGLTVASYLARAGHSVQLLEAGTETGGLAARREFHPGFSAPAVAHLLRGGYHLVADELELKDFGLQFVTREMPTWSLFDDAEILKLSPDMEENRKTLAAWSAQDAERLEAFYQECDAHRDRIETSRLHHRPLDERHTRPGPLERLGLKSGRLKTGRLKTGQAAASVQTVLDSLCLAGQTASAILEGRFSLEALTAMLAIDVSLSFNGGLDSPGSGDALYTSHASWRNRRGCALPAGGLSAWCKALTASAIAAGVTIRTASIVKAIEVDTQNQVAGARLTDDSVIPARRVIAAISPLSVLRDLLPGNALALETALALPDLLSPGQTARVTFALSSLPELPVSRKEARLGRFLVAPDMRYVREAWQDAVSGRLASRPVLEICFPSLADPELIDREKAGAEAQVMSVLVHGIPVINPGRQACLDFGEDAPSSSSASDLRSRTGMRVLQLLESALKGLSQRIEAVQVLLPRDLESHFRLPGGHWHHIDPALAWPGSNRPLPPHLMAGLPKGLCFCSAGSLAGGGINGLAGRACALDLLAIERNRK